MLEGVIRVGGTGTEAAIDGYTLAGKTGTANKIDPKTGTYSESAYVASFVGFAPANDPKLLVTVTVDEPKGGIYGGERRGARLPAHRAVRPPVSRASLPARVPGRCGCASSSRTPRATPR